MKVAIVTDQLNRWGGAEYMVRVISDVFPQAPIYTSVADKDFVDTNFPDKQIKKTFVQLLPFRKRLHDEYIPLYPVAFRLLNFKKYDVVISVSAAFSKFIKTGRRTKHLSICLTPPRFLWSPKTRSKSKENKFTYKIYKALFENRMHERLRKQDKRAIERADKVVSISEEVAKRVKKHYRVDSDVIYPPVEVSEIEPNTDIKVRGECFLYFGRVETYKGVELAIKACIAAEKKLIVAGTGSDLQRMQELVMQHQAENLIKFEGFVSESKKISLFQKSRALIYPVRDEDFGIVPVEANAAGCPVIAYRGGGVVETLSENNPRTAVFFDDYTEEALEKILRNFGRYKIIPQNCRKQANNFAREIFEYKIKTLVEDIYH
ncbi:glycosyltransferase [Candidatus Dojkabacteria bacterium]|nr:glycosyltransferase [Candidatus Dojkabacteria bacterium]